ncbi:MAG TPA: PLP-dependent transferase, partial [Actinomycetota bacterium]|nr:PLP-dependent transferase [Actinomycetota bacterium]
MRKRRPDEYRNSIEGPIYQSASYFFETSEEVVQGLHEKTVPAGRYARYSNPTWLDVEHRLSEVFSAERSLVFASGMAAHFTTFMTLLEPGMEVLLPAESYRQVRNVFHHILPKLGVVVHELSIRDPEAFLNELAALSDRLSCVHLEMPSSPHMYLIDVSEVRAIVGGDVVVTMDTSFAPPPNFSALRWGADLSICSATKYLGGHGDLMAGVVAGRRDLVERITWYRDTTGPVMDGYA